jgi:vacuolar protein sorting-associated protein IST1
MAQLLEAGKIQSARIRVENIIRSDITTELHEVLELYCELVLARSQLLEPPTSPYSSPAPQAGTASLDPALEEAVRSLIYAAPRTEIKELHTTRALLVEKFGKDVALASMEGEGVAERVLNKLKVDTPKPELVDAYLTEIARFYGVPFGATGDNAGEDDDEDGDGGGAGIAEEEGRLLEPALEAETGDAKVEEEVEELAKATPPKKFGPQSPLRITPPSPSTDNVAPKLRLPGASGAAGAGKKSAGVQSKAPASDKLGKIPDVDELARRFAELKR